jgi:hypothetical protein
MNVTRIAMNLDPLRPRLHQWLVTGRRCLLEDIVVELLRRDVSGISKGQLRMLLTLSFVNPGEAITIALNV